MARPSRYQVAELTGPVANFVKQQVEIEVSREGKSHGDISRKMSLKKV